MVSVQFLGSGDAFGDGGRLQACILIAGRASRLLLDCGATSLVALKRAGIDPSSIDCVLVSHLHGDHFGGLPFLILDGQFSRRESPLLVAGPAGLPRRLEETMEALFPGSTQVERRFRTNVVELTAGGTETVGDGRVRAFEVDHASGAPALALRLESEGRTIAYSGDTAWTESLVECARGADIFICEAYTFERKVRYHLDHRTLVEQLPRLGALRTVLTHMGPEMLAHLPEAGVEIAYDGLALEV